MKTTVKIGFRPSHSRREEGVLVLFVTRHRKTCSRTLDIRLLASEWDATGQKILITGDSSQAHAHQLRQQQRKLNRELRLLYKEMRLLEERGNYTAGHLLDRYRLLNRCRSLGEYVAERVSALRSLGNFGTARGYSTALKSFLYFRRDEDISLARIDATTMSCYEQFLKDRGLKPNSISCYMRSLAAVYHHAVHTGIIPGKRTDPFEYVFTGYAPTPKRAIPKKDILKILKTPLEEKQQLSRDLFMFCFFAQGMSYIDAVHLRKENLHGKYIRYKRKKTSQPIQVELLPCMKEIINRYSNKRSTFLFPILGDHQDPEQRLSSTQSGLTRMNRQLKEIASMAGITMPLTSYVARHSWATSASSEGVPISTISRGMGHESEKTTHIYVSRLDYSDVSQANRKLLHIFNQYSTGVVENM